MTDIIDRLNDLEMFVANQEKTIEEMNTEIVRLAKLTDILTAQNKMLMEAFRESPVKPLSEETRPPHY